jgi:hypothetical protein
MSRYAAPRDGDVAHSLASITLAQAWLGYEPFYAMSRGLRETIRCRGQYLTRSEAGGATAVAAQEVAA